MSCAGAGWNSPGVCFGKTFAALVKGLQGSLLRRWVRRVLTI